MMRMRTWSWGSHRCWLRDSASPRQVSGGCVAVGSTEGRLHGLTWGTGSNGNLGAVLSRSRDLQRLLPARIVTVNELGLVLMSRTSRGRVCSGICLNLLSPTGSLSPDKAKRKGQKKKVPQEDTMAEPQPAADTAADADEAQAEQSSDDDDSSSDEER